MLYGRTPEDRALGYSGLVTPIADPEATADAIIQILGNDERRWQMGQSGIQRVERFYNEQDLNFAYLDLYRRYITIGEARRAVGGKPTHGRREEAAWRA